MQKMIGNKGVRSLFAKAIQRKSIPAGGSVAQLVKDLPDNAEVKAVIPGTGLGEQPSIQKGRIIRFFSAGEGGYSIELGSGNEETFDEAFVFPAGQEDAEILHAVKPLIEVIDYNKNFGEKGMKKFNQPTLTDKLSASTKTLKILNTAPTDDVIGHICDTAHSFLALHPFHDGNGRTALFLMYKMALDAQLKIDLSPLELHGIVLGEDSHAKLDANKAGVIERLKKATVPIEDEFDQKSFLDICMAKLITLEADREQKVKLAEALTPNGGCIEIDDGNYEKCVKIFDAKWQEAIGVLKRKGFITARTDVYHSMEFTTYKCYLTNLISLVDKQPEVALPILSNTTWFGDCLQQDEIAKFLKKFMNKLHEAKDLDSEDELSLTDSEEDVSDDDVSSDDEDRDLSN